MTAATKFILAAHECTQHGAVGFTILLMEKAHQEYHFSEMEENIDIKNKHEQEGKKL